MLFLNWLKRPDVGLDMADWDEYPVHLMDGCKLNHKVLGWTMRFNDVLDADKLHSSLTRLLSIGDWRKLGGRLKRNVSFLYATPSQHRHPHRHRHEINKTRKKAS